MKISYSQVENYCNELHVLAKKMNEILENIESEVLKLQSKEKWSGSSADFYVSKIVPVIKNFDEVFKEIENSILYMASCAEGYQAIDQTIVKEICDNLNISSPNLSTSNIFGGS